MVFESFIREVYAAIPTDRTIRIDLLLYRLEQPEREGTKTLFAAIMGLERYGCIAFYHDADGVYVSRASHFSLITETIDNVIEKVNAYVSNLL